MTCRLIYDSKYASTVQETLFPSLQDLVDQSNPYIATLLATIEDGELLVLYLSDQQLKEAIPALASLQDISVAVLPHPEAPHACLGMGVDSNLDRALAHIKSRPKPVYIDMLYCNQKPIFDNVVIGQTFVMTTGKLKKDKKIQQHALGTSGHFLNIKPFLVGMHLGDGKKINTAATDLVIASHREGPFLSRVMPESCSLNDGQMHILVISPQSVMQMLQFAIYSLWKKKKIPHFGAYISTTRINITLPDKVKGILIDGEKHKTRELELHVEKRHLSIVPGSLLQTDCTSTRSGVFKVGGLPTGEAAIELSNNSLPLIRHATAEEFKGLFQTLRENGRLKSTYLVLMVLSTILAAFGLFADSSPVVIGAMILAPLMQPIISLSMGALRQERKLVEDSAITILAGMGLSVVFAVIVTWLTPIKSAGSEIMARTHPNLIDLGVAVVSGIAGAYAHAREEVAQTLAGVAIAVALIPPLAVTAIGLAWGNAEIFWGAALLLGTNLAGIVLAAAATFLFLGYSPFRLATKGLVISLGIVLMLCIPLAYSFRSIIQENRIQRQLEGLDAEVATIKEVHVQNTDPLRISIRVVTAHTLDDNDMDHLKDVIQNRLGRKVELEVLTVMRR